MHLAQAHTGSGLKSVIMLFKEHVVHQQGVFTTVFTTRPMLPWPSILENTCDLIDNAAKQYLLPVVQNVGHCTRDSCRHWGRGTDIRKICARCIRVDLSSPKQRHCVDDTGVLAVLWCRIKFWAILLEAIVGLRITPGRRQTGGAARRHF